MANNWRPLYSGMIQTTKSHVWLWDDTEGVAVKVTVPSRPWKKIDASFTHWMAANPSSKENPPMHPDDARRVVFVNPVDGSVCRIDNSTGDYTELAPSLMDDF